MSFRNPVPTSAMLCRVITGGRDPTVAFHRLSARHGLDAPLKCLPRAAPVILWARVSVGQRGTKCRPSTAARAQCRISPTRTLILRVGGWASWASRVVIVLAARTSDLTGRTEVER